MSKEQFNREMNYQLVCYLVKKLMEKGLLTEAEAKVIYTKSKGIYCPLFSDL